MFHSNRTLPYTMKAENILTAENMLEGDRPDITIYLQAIPSSVLSLAHLLFLLMEKKMHAYPKS